MKEKITSEQLMALAEATMPKASSMTFIEEEFNALSKIADDRLRELARDELIRRIREFGEPIRKLLDHAKDLNNE